MVEGLGFGWNRYSYLQALQHEELPELRAGCDSLGQRGLRNRVVGQVRHLQAARRAERGTTRAQLHQVVYGHRLSVHLRHPHARHDQTQQQFLFANRTNITTRTEGPLKVPLSCGNNRALVLRTRQFLCRLWFDATLVLSTQSTPLRMQVN